MHDNFLDLAFLLLAVAGMDHSQYDCFVCCVLTHGQAGDVLCARDAAMNLEEITDPFFPDNCKTLEGKPKIFIIQVSFSF